MTISSFGPVCSSVLGPGGEEAAAALLRVVVVAVVVGSWGHSLLWCSFLIVVGARHHPLTLLNLQAGACSGGNGWWVGVVVGFCMGGLKASVWCGACMGVAG
jgi:hypothetical protein